MKNVHIDKAATYNEKEQKEQNSFIEHQTPYETPSAATEEVKTEE